MKRNLIYGLYCPFTDELHYIGKSSKGLIRPLEHLIKSHSDKINEWIQQLKFLGHKPIVKILEVCNKTNLNDREKVWIKKSKNCYLLNVANNSTNNILNNQEYEFNDSDILTIAKIIREARKNAEYTQDYISKMAGISRKTYWRIENGNKHIVYNSLKNVLNILGYEIKIQKKDETTSSST